MISADPIICHYNGVDWPASTEILDVTARPIPDSSGRAVAYVQYRIRLRAVFGEENQELGDTTDEDIEGLRLQLTANAGPFRLEFAGFGPLIINVPDEVRSLPDVKWGPKPDVFSWKPLGRAAAEVGWEVMVAVAECPDDVSERGILEWCFAVEWTQTPTGYQTRTHRGHVIIAQTRAAVNDRVVHDSADRLRESIAASIPLIPGFRRSYGPWSLSEDKCRLNWTVTDKECGPNFPPPNITVVSLEHTVSTGIQASFGGKWIATMRATYRIARDTNPAVALAYFTRCLKDRMQQARATPFKAPNGKTKTNAVIILSFQANEADAYDEPVASFTASYSMFSSLPDLVKTSGLWRALPDSDWRLWSTSLADTAFHPRGNAKLRFAGDVIVDLCEQDTPRSRAVSGTLVRGGRTIAAELKNEIPPAETSWLRYLNNVRIEQIDGTVTQQPLPDDAAPPAKKDYNLKTPAADAGNAPGGEPGKPSDRGFIVGAVVGIIDSALGGPRNKPVVQVRSAPTWYAWLEGNAVRAGRPIVPPDLKSVGGRDVVATNRAGCGFKQSVIESLYGVPIHACSWTLCYQILGKPDGKISVMTTPFDGH